jgi:hypothetical protein
MRTFIRIVILLLTTAIASFAQTYKIDWYVIGSGGGTSQNSNYQLSGTIGQPIVGISTSSDYKLEAGFWVSNSIAGGCSYIDGDANNSGAFNGIDVTYSVTYFKGGPLPPYSCECTTGNTWFVAGDVNGNCAFNGIDVSYMVGYFKGGPGPIPCPQCPPAGMVAPPAPAVMPINNPSRKGAEKASQLN